MTWGPKKFRERRCLGEKRKKDEILVASSSDCRRSDDVRNDGDHRSKSECRSKSE